MEKYKKGDNPLVNSLIENKVKNLLKHVEKGCLSDIDPRVGTVIQELAHKHLNGNIVGVSNLDSLYFEGMLVDWIFSYANGGNDVISYEEYKIKVLVGEIDESKLEQRPSIWQSESKLDIEAVDAMRIPNILNDKKKSKQFVQQIALKLQNLFHVDNGVKQYINKITYLGKTKFNPLIKMDPLQYLPNRVNLNDHQYNFYTQCHVEEMNDTLQLYDLKTSVDSCSSIFVIIERAILNKSDVTGNMIKSRVAKILNPNSVISAVYIKEFLKKYSIRTYKLHYKKIFSNSNAFVSNHSKSFKKIQNIPLFQFVIFAICDAFKVSIVLIDSNIGSRATLYIGMNQQSAVKISSKFTIIGYNCATNTYCNITKSNTDQLIH
eukprot:380388_1